MEHYINDITIYLPDGRILTEYVDDYATADRDSLGSIHLEDNDMMITKIDVLDKKILIILKNGTYYSYFNMPYIATHMKK